MILLIWCLSLLTIRRFLFRHLKFIFIQIIIENFDEGFWIIFFKDFSLKLDLNTIFKISFSDFFFFEIFSAKFCIKWINFYCSRKKNLISKITNQLVMEPPGTFYQLSRGDAWFFPKIKLFSISRDEHKLFLLKITFRYSYRYVNLFTV